MPDPLLLTISRDSKEGIAFCGASVESYPAFWRARAAQRTEAAIQQQRRPDERAPSDLHMHKLAQDYELRALAAERVTNVVGAPRLRLAHRKGRE